MAKYLNKEIREELVVMDVTVDYIRMTIEKWQDSKSMKDEKKLIGSLKQSTTLAYNALRNFLSNYDKSDIETMQRKKDATEVALIPKSYYEVVKENQKTMYWLTRDQAYEISEGMVESFCRGCERNHEKCEIRSLFIAWQIPAAVCETEGCQYKY